MSLSTPIIDRKDSKEASSVAASSSAAGLAAALNGVALMRLEDVGWIRVTGEDRVRWLNGMVTNSIQALKPGEGCYNFLLNAQGRIQGTAMAFAEAEAVRLETDRARVEPMMALLDRFIIMDDVELADVSAVWTGVLAAGPGAASLLRQMELLPQEPADGGAAIRFHDGTWRGEALRVQRMPGKVVARYEIWAEPAVLEQVMAELQRLGVVEADAQVLEWLRMLEGTPRFGMDIRDRELAQETGQTDALHFSKGCYLGQEIVERIRSRGSVHRIFHGFVLGGTLPEQAPLPERGAALLVGEKAVGELTSVAELPPIAAYPRGLRLGLGYIRREAIEMGQAITCAGGTASPLTLPVRIADAPQAHPTGQ